ncbi:MAG TPA: hypothetical protein VFU95_06925 [Telluria sp.]|nr:hypothetical protein [Telluria sp.]
MKTLIVVCAVAAAAALSGCAYDAPRGAYGTAYAPPADPGQWHVVSVTPVAPGTGDRLAASSGTGSATQYSSAPIVSQPVYVPQPVYVQQPVYYPAPVYYAPSPYYYPPVSIGLDLGFGRSWGGRHGGRNWGGIGIGTRFGR